MEIPTTNFFDFMLEDPTKTNHTISLSDNELPNVAVFVNSGPNRTGSCRIASYIPELFLPERMFHLCKLLYFGNRQYLSYVFKIICYLFNKIKQLL